jgi:peroxiredoxin
MYDWNKLFGLHIGDTLGDILQDAQDGDVDSIKAAINEVIGFFKEDGSKQCLDENKRFEKAIAILNKIPQAELIRIQNEWRKKE